MRRWVPWLVGGVVMTGGLGVAAAVTSRPPSHDAAVRRAERVAATVAAATVTLATPDGEIHTSAGAIGLRVDTGATTAAAEDETWWGRLRPGGPPVVVSVNPVKVGNIVEVHDPTDRREPTEPSIVLEDGELRVTGGQAGSGLDPGDVVDAIVDAARSGGRDITVSVDAVRLPPRHARSEATALLARARNLTDEPLPVLAGDVAADVPVRTLRRWIRSRATAAGLQLALDPDTVIDDLEELLSDAGSEPVDAAVAIVDGAPVVTPAVDGTSCCALSSVAVLEAAVRHRPTEAVQLPLRTRPAAVTTEEVSTAGIVEEVGSFTTRHPAGQPRVVNIHRIADLVRGVVIEPGASFSMNDHVGRRTEERGFVSGGVIEDGKFSEDVGGGISQFATTLFNAAFFAGLDFREYQSHSIWLSRYPRGREATLSWPGPDLVIRNATPHGVLIWPTYTSRSITVALWSTTYAPGVQTNQSESKVGNCTRVRTDRTRTYPDGTTKEDAVFATYRPEEGVNC